MSYSSIIFDLDGTLLDTLGDIAETANTVLAHYGFPVHPQEAYRHFVGDGTTRLIERITPEGVTEHIHRKCYRLFLKLYGENWKNSCRPYRGIVEMLTALNKQGIRMAVLSNKPHAFTTLFVDEFLPGQNFSFVYGQREGFAKKPDPTVALEIAEKMRSHPRNMLFVGDTKVDIRTGKAAGMTTVGVSWGFRGIRELQENNADIIINSPMELLQYVLPLA
jgi:phosphoglycolate phosphatase